jgi:hypothetical protein
MGIIILIGQILLGIPFVVFAYWYEREEALFQTAKSYGHTIYRHAVFGLFFSVSFAILGMVFFPRGTGTTVLFVNRHSIGTPDRHPKGTPLSFVLGD